MRKIREEEERQKRQKEDEMTRIRQEELKYVKDIEDRKKRQEDDERLAKVLYDEEVIRMKEEERKTRESKDQELAKKLLDQERQDQERIRNLNVRDAEYARNLYEDEKRKIEDEKKRLKEEEEKLNYQKTMDMIRSEVRSESDMEMARILREKEELERRLQQVNDWRDRGEIDINGVQFPNTWVYQASDVQNFDVQMYTQEWYNVYNAFVRTCNNKTVTRIERVQNKPLYTWFHIKKQFMSKKYGGPNERWLFHGSKTNAYDIILRDGFDHRVADLNGVLGAGIYFAENASYSVNYIPNTNNGPRRKSSYNYNNTKRMMYCRVLLGQVGRGQQGIRRPPNKPNSNELYDSVSNNNSTFALFDNHQAFPEYIVHFY